MFCFVLFLKRNELNDGSIEVFYYSRYNSGNFTSIYSGHIISFYIIFYRATKTNVFMSICVVVL